MSSGKNSWLGALLAICLIAALGTACFLLFRPKPEPVPGRPSGDAAIDLEAGQVAGDAGDESKLQRFTPKQMSTAIEAVAATEEADFDRARKLWAGLAADFPDDQDILVNEAVAVLKWIHVIENSLDQNGPDVTPQQRESLSDELESAYRYSDTVTGRLAVLEKYDFRVPLIRARVLQSKANRLTYPADTEPKKQAAQILAEALDRDPAQPFLVEAYDRIVTSLAGLAPELEAKQADYLYAGFLAQPDNLFLLKQAAEALMRDEDARLKELLPMTLELTRSMWSSQQRAVDRVQPEILVANLSKAIDDGNWREVGRLRMWLNVILGMEGFNADAKRVAPDPLELLNTEFLITRAPQAELAQPKATLPEYQVIAADVSASVVAWYDIDFDLEYDVVAGAEQQLQFLKLTQDSLIKQQTLDVGKRIEGILPIDLFEVQSPEAPKLPTTVAELMRRDSETPPAGSADAGQGRGSNSTTGSEPGSETGGARHSALQELLVWGEDGLAVVTYGEGGFQVVEVETGLESLRGVTLIQAADIESDGDLDLLVVTEGQIQLMQNNGNRTFSDITQYTKLPAAGTQIQAAIGCDYDRDMDQDFVLLTNTGTAVLENILHGQFRFRALDTAAWPGIDDATGLAVGDFDNNRSWDFAIGGPAGGVICHTLTPAPGSLTATRQVDLPLVAGNEIIVEDLNNDGRLDVVAASGAGGSLVLGGLNDQFNEPVPLTSKATSSLSAMDSDYDGQLELLMIEGDRPTVFRLKGKPTGKFALVRAVGIMDSNGGGRINHYCLGSTLEVWADNRLYSRIIQSPVTHFGFGQGDPQNLRIVFTNGLTQNVENVAADTLIEEMQLMRGSCPYVYGWDGQRFELITDLLWNAPLGLQTSRGETLRDRRWEHLLLPGELIQAQGDVIPLRVTEELWEVAYFDHIQLTAVDHPASVEVFTNEKVGPPSIAQPQMFTVGSRQAALRAKDAYGRDWTEALARRDSKFAQAFEIQICQGLVEPHFIELDFGTLPVAETELRLFLTGWLYPTDTSQNIGISQNPERQLPEPASLWVVDAGGNWVCAKPFMGFPGGKPKSIVIDLSDVFLSDDHRIRVAASQQLYWDEAFVSWDSDASQLQQQVLQMQAAELVYRGFSQPLPRANDQPHWFDYQSVSTAPNWPPLAGPFTRYGDVLFLLDNDDDRMVVLTSGDEIQLRFGAPLEPPPAGWKRDYVLHNTGWDKDADINTLAGQGSLPLPFMDQTSYPAAVEQAEQVADVLRKNVETLTRYPSYRELRYPARVSLHEAYRAGSKLTRPGR